MAKKNKINSETIKNARLKLAVEDAFEKLVFLTLAGGIVTSVQHADIKTTSADVVAQAASEDLNPIVHQLSEQDETMQRLNDESYIWDEAAKKAAETSIQNDRSDIAKENQADASNEQGEEELPENVESDILNPEETNPEINPNKPDSNPVDDIINNLPDTKNEVHGEMNKKAKGWGLVAALGALGAAALASIAIIAKKFGLSNSKKADEYFNKGK